MDIKKVDFNNLALSLQDHCPFILFAMLTGFDAEKEAPVEKNLELSVFLEPGTGFVMALEKILLVAARAAPDFFCEITILNRIDADSRFRAAGGTRLFIRAGKEDLFKMFVTNASFDYRLKRAHMRLQGKQMGEGRWEMGDRRNIYF